MCSWGHRRQIKLWKGKFLWYIKKHGCGMPTKWCETFNNIFHSKTGKANVIEPNFWEQSFHQVTSDNGEFLTNFAVAIDLLIGRTIFYYRNINKATWISSERKACNEIDYILTDHRHWNDLLDARCFIGANVNSDLFLLLWKK